MYSEQFEVFKENVEQDKLIRYIKKLNKDESIDGILVQMPLPKHINENTIQNAIDYTKDVDGLTDINMGKLVHGVDSLVACTPVIVLRTTDHKVTTGGEWLKEIYNDHVYLADNLDNAYDIAKVL